MTVYLQIDVAALIYALQREVHEHRLKQHIKLLQLNRHLSST